MSDNDMTRREYQTEIESIVNHIEDRLSEDPESELSEMVFEEVDSHEWIIYTSYHLDILQHTSEGPQEWKHFVSDGDDYQSVIQAMAFDALRNDVWAEIHDRDSIDY